MQPDGPRYNPLVVVPARRATYAVGIDSSESIPSLLNRLQIRAGSEPVCCSPD
jgi:hypothetical protein